MKNVYVYPHIIDEMIKHGDDLNSLASKLEITKNELSLKLKGIQEFELGEFAIMMKMYDVNFEYLDCGSHMLRIK